MSIRRITISVPEEVAARIKRAAGATPVSTWVTKVIEDELDEAELQQHWEAFYRDVKPGPRAKRRAAAIVRSVKKRGRRRPAA